MLGSTHRGGYICLLTPRSVRSGGVGELGRIQMSGFPNHKVCEQPFQSLEFIWNLLFGYWNFSIRGCTKSAKPSEKLTMINEKLLVMILKFLL
jgi:hypothetical protein